MPSSSGGQPRVSIGLVLISVGLILLFAVAAIYLLGPPGVSAALLRGAEPILPVPVREAIAKLGPSEAAIRSAGANSDLTSTVLLPGSPLDGSFTRPDPGLPSFASLEEAPRQPGGERPNEPRRLVIPTLGIDSPIRQVGLVATEHNGQEILQWEVPDQYEVGWHMSSAPLGQTGNTVLNGHNNIYGEVFKGLINLKPGERITVYDQTQAHEYIVREQVLLPERNQSISTRLMNARWIEATADERLTLVSCWPYLTNDHRLIVVATPIDSALVP